MTIGLNETNCRVNVFLSLFGRFRFFLVILNYSFRVHGQRRSGIKSYFPLRNEYVFHISKVEVKVNILKQYASDFVRIKRQGSVVQS